MSSVVDLLGARMNEPLTAEQAAKELGYHLHHVYRMMRSGKLKARRFSGVWLTDRQEVERIKALQGPKGRLPRAKRGEHENV
jgi:excisionase family DNA binding protein